MPAAGPAALGFVLLVLLGCDRGATPTQSRAEPPAPTPWIEREVVSRLSVELAPGATGLLEENPRAYVRCVVIEEDGTRHDDVGLKLRGRLGSFRGLDERPAFTLNFDKFRRGRRFHGHEKLYCGNSVQDGSYAREWLGALICAEAGIPTPRVAHSRVALDGKSLGLYVIKEGFDRAFLARHFADPAGNLYDDAVRQDLDGELEKDGGDGPDDASDVLELLETCMDQDPAPRWTRLAERLDVPAFLRFAAFETMAAHWDGYCWNRNNYRLYFEPGRRVARLLPFGMDQIFGSAEFPVLEHPPAIVAMAVMPNPTWRAQYREQLRQLLPLFAPEHLVPQIHRIRNRLQPHARELGLADAVFAQFRHLEDEVCARHTFLLTAVTGQDPAPQAFPSSGIAVLEDWTAADGATAQLERTAEGGLAITAAGGAPSHGAWRCTTYLAAGRYRVTARCVARGVVPLGPEVGGAALRVAGVPGARWLVGDDEAGSLVCESTVKEPLRRVDWVIELTAQAGRIEVAPAIRLERLGP